jgi:hypothetical protein
MSQMDPTFAAVGIVVIAAGVVFAVRVASRNAASQAKFRKEQDALELEMNTQEARESAEATAAALLVAPAPSARDVIHAAQKVIDQFGALRSFQDVAVWDAAARQAQDGLAAHGNALQTWVDSALAAIAQADALDEAGHIKRARKKKTAASVKAAQEQIEALTEAYDALDERVEMTPDNKKAQQAVLRDLRAQKKELQAEKRESRTAAAQVRREARVASAAAGTVWMFYDAKVAAIQRRRIRREKEAAVAPHEDAASAIERRINALERRITWVARFGDAPDSDT